MFEVGPVEYWSCLGNVDQVRQAIEEGGDINASSDGGYTALHGAVENDHIEVVRMLLAAGARTDLRLDSGETPLDFAIRLGRGEIIHLLRRFPTP